MQQHEEDRVSTTFCFIDVAGFTALTEAHGDEAAADLVERLTSLVRDTVAMCGEAALLEIVGDAALIRCANPARSVDIVRSVFRKAATESNFPVLRAGLHYGPVLQRGGRFFGTTLNLAARVASMARGGQVLCTHTVAEAAAEMGVATHSLGSRELRNLTTPVELFELRFDTEADDTVIDPVCRMRVHPSTAAGSLRHDDRTWYFCSLACVRTFAERPEVYTGHQNG